MGYRIAIDIGGGFTDLVAVDEQTGEMIWSKTRTTPDDLTQGIIDVFELSKIDPSSCTQIVHGQTLVINAIVQRKGARVGLITTKGFRDVLEIQRANRRDIFNLLYKKPDPIVPRNARLEIGERVRADGAVLQHLDRDELAQVHSALLAQGVESIAVCFINSYVNPSNEREALETLRFDGMKQSSYITISSDVTKEWREYERTNTAVLNAYVMPLIDRYLRKLVQDFAVKNFRGAFYMMLSSGGVATFDFARSIPIETIESGPVAGVVAGQKLAELIGEKNVIVLDGGSTTTKASLLENLSSKLATNYAIERDEFNPGYPVRVPVVDIVEIGSGGASVAWMDELGNLRVGPVNAGASPGPACYGMGGEEPTVTDAFFHAGLLNPDYFLGGQVRIRKDLATETISRIAEKLGTNVDEAAFAIIRLANDNAAQVLRLISVQRGYDPRDFALIAHGGSGPMFSPFIAEELEISKVIIPVIPSGNFSAWGLLQTDLKFDRTKTIIARLDADKVVEPFNWGYEELESEVTSLFAESGVKDRISLARTADLRYYGQEHTINIPVGGGRMGKQHVADVGASFQSQHQREYGFVLDSPVELVSLRVSGTVQVKKPAVREHHAEKGASEAAVKGEREVYWGGAGWETTTIYERGRLPPGSVVRWPAIIEEPTTTTLVSERYAAKVDRYGNLELRRT